MNHSRAEFVRVISQRGLESHALLEERWATLRGVACKSVNIGKCGLVLKRVESLNPSQE